MCQSEKGKINGERHWISELPRGHSSSRNNNKKIKLEEVIENVLKILIGY